MIKQEGQQVQSLPRPASAKAASFAGVATKAESAGRPPIVAVLGHVDHGKTTLLDYIRKTSVAASEHGGITQHIGAYQVTVRQKAEPSSRATPSEARGSRGIPSKNKGILPPTESRGKDDRSAEGRTITFIDTPGHEAFSKMRSRGASVADIAVLVVAADDSVKPQTVESIEQIKKAGIPMIVAVNKIDLPTANLDKVKQDLAKAGVQVEGFGGDVPTAAISAKQGTGVRELLDLILLVADMKGITGDPNALFEAVAIETKLDKFRGMVATLVVKQGTLSVGTSLYEGAVNLGRVRASFDENGDKVDEASPSKPVEVLGFSQLPAVGSIIRSQPEAAAPSAKPAVPAKREVTDFLAMMEEKDKKKLTLILKTDTAGSQEAILAALPPAKVSVVRAELGEITEADILDARASGAIIVGFNVKAGSSVIKLAQAEKVIVRNYTIIYELLDELADVMEGLEEVLSRERELGVGQIIAEFPYEDMRIAGTKVTSGRLARGDTVRIMRGETEVARARIKSMRRGKEDITKAEVGLECGILFDKKVDFLLQDGIIAFTTG